MIATMSFMVCLSACDLRSECRQRLGNERRLRRYQDRAFATCVRLFAMLAHVHADALDPWHGTQGRHQRKPLQNCEGHYSRIERRAETGEGLHGELMRVTEQQPVAAGGIPALLRQPPGEQGAGEPADAVASKDIER